MGVADTIAEMVRAGFDYNKLLEATRPFPPLHELAQRYLGIRPGRTLSLYEALVDSVIKQRITLRATARLVKAYSPRVEVGGRQYYSFPPPAG